jgi:sugar-specific transcriptional regulator TrmB
MDQKTIGKILKNFGLTETETEVYVFLAKHGILKCADVSRQMKKDRAQSMRILKSLQSKGLVEATLESPIRYTPVPFEQIIDLSIKAKRDEAAQIEKQRSELLSYWNKTGNRSALPPSERFFVIEDENKIFAKIIKMVGATRKRLSSVCTVEGLVRASHFGLFESISDHPLNSTINFRFLTEVTNSNLTTVTSLLRGPLKTNVNLKGRNPDLGLRLFPRMVIRDNEEIILFIKPRTREEKSDDLCLWTNCEDLVQSFSAVFEDLWSNATDLEKKVNAFAIPKTGVTKQQYKEKLVQAKQEIIILTSSERLNEFSKKAIALKEAAKRKVSVKIMAPITMGNMEAARSLSEFCEVRHISSCQQESTVIDGQHLFRLTLREQERMGKILSSEGLLYTNNLAEVKNTKKVLENIWKNAQVPSPITLASILGGINHSDEDSFHEKVFSHVKKASLPVPAGSREPFKKLTEQDILKRILEAQKNPMQNQLTNDVKLYGYAAEAIIHPPPSIYLPDMLVYLMHYEKQSTFGEEDCIFFSLWSKTPKGYAYVPAVVLHDNTESSDFWKRLYGNVIIQEVKKDEIKIQLHGKNFFCGWTGPLRLTTNLRLEASSIILEGNGALQASGFSVLVPTGHKITQEFNSYEAFVTFYHPLSRYSGPGTEGFIHRDLITSVSLV